MMAKEAKLRARVTYFEQNQQPIDDPWKVQKSVNNDERLGQNCGVKKDVEVKAIEAEAEEESKDYHKPQRHLQMKIPISKRPSYRAGIEVHPTLGPRLVEIAVSNDYESCQSSE